MDLDAANSDEVMKGENMKRKRKCRICVGLMKGRTKHRKTDQLRRSRGA